MTYSAEVLADSPLAYWRLGDASGTTMVDSSGNSRNGTYVNSPTLGSTGLLVGDADTAVTFDGTNDRADVTYGAWMDASTAFTVEAWIRPTGSLHRPIVDRDHSSGRVFQFRINGGKIDFIKIGGTGGIVSATSVATITNSTTYHVVATYDGTNIRLYINGSLDNTVSAAGTLGTGNSPLAIGITYGGSSSPTNFYSGVIDEVAIYGSVLSGTRIGDHYTAGTTAGITVALDRFTSAATFLDVVPSSSIEVALDRFTSAATMLDVAPLISIPTDVTNLFDGLDLGCLGQVTMTYPEVVPPTAPPRHDKALPYPEPVMVDGRPT